MGKQTDIWGMIDRAAAALGVKADNRRKWRERKSVPHRWRLPLIRETGGALSADDLETPNKKGRK